nr:FAD-binding protein [Chloroflexota bacterium]
GRDLGAAADYLDAYQGHVSVADGYGTLVTWATVMQGGFLVNLQGRRFGDESQGYSEFARVVLTQPDGLAWLLFDRRVFDRVQSFQDIQECTAAGAFRHATTIEAFAERAHLPADALGETLATYNRAARGEAPDPFGRQAGPPLDPPFVGVGVLY